MGWWGVKEWGPFKGEGGEWEGWLKALGRLDPKP